jgi:hypothetical protein
MFDTIKWGLDNGERVERIYWNFRNNIENLTKYDDLTLSEFMKMVTLELAYKDFKICLINPKGYFTQSNVYLVRK